MNTLEARLKQKAKEVGFDLAGIAPAAEADGFDRLREWLDAGFAGEMEYMSRHSGARRHPESILSSVRSVVMVALNYKPQAEDEKSRSLGRVARYARGPDYHDLLRIRLSALLAWVQEQSPGCRGRGVVDTAPLLERDFARRAGLGWFGKNTMLLNKKLGSYFFLGALLLDLKLDPDAPHAMTHCGTCTACLDACPTQAFPAPGQLDSRKCISYLTIELRTPIPAELREGIGDWIFGCDVCQEVCPWNRKAPGANDAMFPSRSDLIALDPVALLGLAEKEFSERFRDTAMMRTKREGLLRNAALVLGNYGDAKAIPALRGALNDPSPMVREAAQWAIERIGMRSAISSRNEKPEEPRANA